MMLEDSDSANQAPLSEKLARWLTLQFCLITVGGNKVD